MVTGFHMDMKHFEYWCIFCSQLPDRQAMAEREFQNHDLDVSWWQSIHAKSFGIVGYPWGPTDLVAFPHRVSPGYIGLAIGWWTLLQHLLLSNRPGPFLIFEDDVLLAENFKKRLSSACEELPDDWQIVLVGSPWGVASHVPVRINGNVCQIGNANCWGTHAVLFHRSALPFLMKVNHCAELPLDAQLNKTSYRKLNTYACAPTLAMQRSNLPVSDGNSIPTSCG